MKIGADAGDAPTVRRVAAVCRDRSVVGLAVVGRIAEAHDWRIHVIGREAGGARWRPLLARRALARSS